MDESEGVWDLSEAACKILHTMHHINMKRTNWRNKLEWRNKIAVINLYLHTAVF